MNLPVETLSRVLHVLAAILLMGGALFTWLALLPAARQLPMDEQEKLSAAIAKRWRMLVGLGIAILIFSGFYNYLTVAVPRHKGDSLYHALMGIKIVLAFVVFFIASALPGRGKWKPLVAIRRNYKCWLLVTISLATVIVAIAGFLKVRGVT